MKLANEPIIRNYGDNILVYIFTQRKVPVSELMEKFDLNGAEIQNLLNIWKKNNLISIDLQNVISEKTISLRRKGEFYVNQIIHQTQPIQKNQMIKIIIMFLGFIALAIFSPLFVFGEIPQGFITFWIWMIAIVTISVVLAFIVGSYRNHKLNEKNR